MSDRAALTVVVYDGPEDELVAIVEVFRKWDLNADFGFSTEELASIALGEQYGYDEIRIGDDDEIFGELVEAAPGSTFVVSQDPKYEYDGSVHMYVPELGAFSGTGNSDGEPYVTADVVRKASSLGELKLRLGLPWLDRMQVKEPA